mgnify:CR=1 FL=1
MSFAANVNADLAVGSLAETVTVSGESPHRGRSEHEAEQRHPGLRRGCASDVEKSIHVGRARPRRHADRRAPGCGRHAHDADHDVFDPRQPPVRPAAHGQRHHVPETSSRRPGPATSCPTWGQPQKPSSTTHQGRPTRSAAVWASTSSRRKAATDSWGRSSSRAPTARFRGITTPDETEGRRVVLAKRAETRLRHQPVGRRADRSRQTVVLRVAALAGKLVLPGRRLCQPEWRRFDEVDLRPGLVDTRVKPVDRQPQRECAA